MSPPHVPPPSPEPPPARPAPPRPESPGRYVSNAGSVCVVLALSVGAGYVLAKHSSGLLHDRMLPWILSRCLGLAAVRVARRPRRGGDLVPPSVAAFTGGRPARRRFCARMSPSRPSTVVLLAGHIVAVCPRFVCPRRVDRHPRPLAFALTGRPPSALGSIAMYGIVLVAGTAALGRLHRPADLAADPFDLGCHLRPLSRPRPAVRQRQPRPLGDVRHDGTAVGLLMVSRMLARPVELAEAW